MSNHWTSDRIPDLTGKVAIVTGANSGIGYDTAKELARKGAQTILACRSVDKAELALERINEEYPDAPVELMKLDLASLQSVRDFAGAFGKKYDRLDLLINNAGIMMVPYGLTEDGFESQLGTNHLGHFALTGLLIEHLMSTPHARIVNVSSMAHLSGRMDFDNLMFEDGKGYTPTAAYGRSKLSNLLFTYELQRRLEAKDSDTIAVAAHPGSTNTNLQDEIGEWWFVKPFMPLMRAFMQSSAMGALPTLMAAVEPDVSGGAYFGPRGFMEQKGYPVKVTSNKRSHNEADAKRLWAVSEVLTGVSYLSD